MDTIKQHCFAHNTVAVYRSTLKRGAAMQTALITCFPTYFYNAYLLDDRPGPKYWPFEVVLL